jgi:hypothetical protein
LSSDNLFSDPKKPVSGSDLKQAQIGRILANGRNKKFTYSRFAARSHAKRAIVRSRKKMLKKRPLWAGKGHYMGFNLGAFRQNTQLKRFFSTRTKSDGFTGVFF